LGLRNVDELRQCAELFKIFVWYYMS
jgi:hypothetical protein